MRFWTVTPVWIHWWIWNETQSWCCIEDMPYYFSGHPSNFKVTRAKNWRFESNLSKITRPVAAIKSLRFALLLIGRWSAWEPEGLCKALPCLWSAQASGFNKSHQHFLKKLMTFCILIALLISVRLTPSFIYLTTGHHLVSANEGSDGPANEHHLQYYQRNWGWHLIP